MGLEPNMLKEINGTEFNYTLRNQEYHIKLSEGSYQINAKSFLLKSKNGLGVNMSGNTLLYYPNNRNNEELSVVRKNSLPINIEISEWGKNRRSWILNSAGHYKFFVAGLKPNSLYNLIVNGNREKSYNANSVGVVSFEYTSQIPTGFCVEN